MCRNGFIYFPEFCRYAAMAVRCEMLVGVLLNADDEGDDDDDGDGDGDGDDDDDGDGGSNNWNIRNVKGPSTNGCELMMKKYFDKTCLR